MTQVTNDLAGWLIDEPAKTVAAHVLFTRQFSMGNPETFLLPPVWKLLARHINPQDLVIDPFARNSKWGTITNDLNPDTNAEYHLPAEEFVEHLEVEADVVLFDPPYSPRQIAECYQHIGRKVKTEDTQNARLYKRVKDGLDKVLKPGGIAICCGWNSMGFGLTRGYEMLEILLVPHGAAHNDTIVTVERKRI
jgi:hypothetical protein